MKKNKDFQFEKQVTPKNPNNENTLVVTDDDFKLVDNSDYSHDQKFETKPTTFLKDSLKRFSKNKSSVVATYILGILLLGSVLIPVLDTSVVDKPNPYQTYLEPKLFDSGTGFWDGTRRFTNIPYDPVTGKPDPLDFNPNAIDDDDFQQVGQQFTNSYSKYGQGGYVKLGRKADELDKDSTYLENIGFTLSTLVGNTVVITFAEEEIELTQLAPYRIELLYNEGVTEYSVLLKDYSQDFDTFTFDLTTILTTHDPLKDSYDNARFCVIVDNSDKSLDSYVLIQSIVFETDSANSNYKEMFEAPTFTDANEMVGRAYKVGNYVQPNYWNSDGDKHLYKAVINSCSFTYDTYEGAFGIREMIIDEMTMNTYIQNGWLKYKYSIGPSSFEILDSDRCPIVDVISQSETGQSTVLRNMVCKVIYYRYLGMSSMPRYLMGTDKRGRDMLKYVFEGLRTSLLLGIVTSAICFIFGLCWGAISGYFGGNIDLAMERFTDILGGLPWIVIMTLSIIHLGQNFLVFAMALCLTGWIGTSATTRTQFYRFKGREYVLASRTLGASDLRLIFKHILPNAMGTIITGAVLMIPGVIFSEATISYLGLGLKGMSSLGVILSSNQGELLAHPFLLIFPSVIIALLEISFNLFGNGLRDAINPTLKGEGE